MRANLNPAISATGLVLLLVLSGAWPALALDRSQVFSLHTPLEGQPLSVLEDYRVDTIGWGSSDDPNMQAVRDMGIEYHMAMSLSIWGGAAAADPQTLTGQQVCISFLGERIPAYGTGFPQGGLFRMCTNKPGWNFAWLEQYAADGTEGFEMDCPMGNSIPM